MTLVMNILVNLLKMKINQLKEKLKDLWINTSFSHLGNFLQTNSKF